MSGTRAAVKRRAKGQARRTALLHAVIAVIERDGLEAVSHRNVAAQANVPAASVGYYFDGIEAMVQEAFELFVGEQIARLTPVLDTAHDTQVSPRELVATIAQTLWEGRAGVRAQFSLYLAAEGNPRLAEIARRCVAHYEDLARQALHGAGVPDAEALAPAVVALIDGMALRRPSLGSGDAQQAMSDALLRLIEAHR